MIKTLGEIAENYKKENATLKKQIAETRYLNRDKVEKILSPYTKQDNVGEYFWSFNEEDMENFITAICTLVIPEIDKDKIAETKTLDKEEVGKILSNIPYLKMNLNLNLISDFMEFRDLAVDEICKLAIRKIDKEEIIAVIDFWVYELSRTYTDFDLIEPYDVNKLANEIVKKLEV